MFESEELCRKEETCKYIPVVKTSGRLDFSYLSVCISLSVHLGLFTNYYRISVHHHSIYYNLVGKHIFFTCFLDSQQQKVFFLCIYYKMHSSLFSVSKHARALLQYNYRILDKSARWNLNNKVFWKSNRVKGTE